MKEGVGETGWEYGEYGRKQKRKGEERQGTVGEGVGDRVVMVVCDGGRKKDEKKRPGTY